MLPFALVFTESVFNFILNKWLNSPIAEKNINIFELFNIILVRHLFFAK